MNNQIDSKRKQWIDISKGIAIILVEFSHNGCIPFVWFLISPFYVAVFFILSGYTYTEKSHNYGEFVSSKIYRLLYPYIFYNIIICICSVLLGRDLIRTFLGALYSRFCIYPLGNDENVILLTYNAPTWFLTALFLSLILFKLILRVSRNKVFFILLIIIFLVITKLLTYLPILLPWSLDSVFLFSILIFVGYQLKDIFIYRIKYHFPVIIVMIIGLIIYPIISDVNGLINLSVRIYGNNIVLFLFTSIIGSCCLMLFSKKIERFKIGKYLSIVGRHSLNIFCIHSLFLVILNKIIQFSGIPVDNFGISSVVVLLTTVISVYLSIFLRKHFSFL